MIRTPAHKQTDPNKAPGMVRDNEGKVTFGRKFHQWYQLNKHKFNYDYEKAKEIYEQENKPAEDLKPLEPPIDVGATKTLGDYIQRVVEAEKGLPEPVTVDRKVLQQCADALTWSNPYIAAILQQALDKAKDSVV